MSLALLMLVFWWAGSLTSRLLAESFAYERLESDATSLLAAMDFQGGPALRPRLGVARLSAAYERPASGKYYAIWFEHDRDLLSRSSWDQGFLVSRLAPGEQRRIRLGGIAGEPLLMWLGGFTRAGQSFTVAIAEDITPIRHRLTLFQWYFAAISLLLLMALMYVQRQIVRRSLFRLEAIRGDINRLEHGQAVALSEDVPSEIRPLVTEFNRLLNRFDQRLRQSRNAVGNLAHSLKGPLNLLLRAAESGPSSDDRFDDRGAAGGPLQRRSGDDDRKARDNSIRHSAERIHQIIESELRRARLAGRGAAGQLFDLEAELPALVGLLEQVYSEKKIDVRYQIGSDVELIHDRQDMLELIGNLLDNAVKWASSTVIVTIRSADGVLLEVDDDGPGVSVDELSRLTQRGVRLDESVAGHGLGLSIVRDIVDIYEGQLDLGRSNRLGGLRVSVKLPGSASTED